MIDIDSEIHKIQRDCCTHYQADFMPPGRDKLVVISEGVYEEGTQIEGVRYPSPDHMSGWWLTTEKYTGDIGTLKTVHFQHIIDKRPEVAIYMALPFGYRFILGGTSEHVWFDSEVSVSKAD